MRARTVNENMDFERGRSSKSSIGVGNSRDINILLDTLVHEKAKAHGFELYNDRENSVQGRVIVYITPSIRFKPVDGWRRSNSIMIAKLGDPSMYGDRWEEIKEKSEQDYIVRYLRSYNKSDGSHRNVEEYVSPRDLWQESWWDKVDSELHEVPPLTESVDFKRGGSVKTTLGVGSSIEKMKDDIKTLVYFDELEQNEDRIFVTLSNPDLSAAFILTISNYTTGPKVDVDFMEGKYSNEMIPDEVPNYIDKIFRKKRMMYESIEFQRGGNIKSTLDVGPDSINRKKAEWILENMHAIRYDWGYERVIVDIFQNISYQITEGECTLKGAILDTMWKWPTYDYNRTGKKGSYDKLIEELKKIGFVVTDEDYFMKESLDFQRGQGAKKAVGVQNIDVLFDSVLPRKAEEHGFNLFSDYTREEFGRNMMFARKSGERVGYNQRMTENISTGKIWAAHRSSSNWDEIQKKMDQDYIITWSITFNKKEEEYKSFEVYVSPRDLWTDKWWNEMEETREKLMALELQ